MSTWKTLLLIYDRMDVTFTNRERQLTSFANTLTEEEVHDGTESFSHFPKLVNSLTSGSAKIEYDVVHASEPLTTVSSIREHELWPSPNDTRNVLGPIFAAKTYHSVFIYWSQHNAQTNLSVPSHAWGWSMGASEWSFDATYATVANAPSRFWQVPMVGEVWLHEWLHGACAYFSGRGHKMPTRDADGGGSANDIITLLPKTNSNLYASKALMLVADDADKVNANTGLPGGGDSTPGHPDYRIRKALLGDKVYFKLTPAGNNVPPTIYSLPIFNAPTTAKPVVRPNEPDAVKTLNVHVVNTRGINGSTPDVEASGSDAYINTAIQTIQQRYAVAGVKANVMYNPTTDVLSVPKKSNANPNGIDLISFKQATPQGLSTDELSIIMLLQSKYGAMFNRGNTIYVIVIRQFSHSP